jgi:hypothetical protein
VGVRPGRNDVRPRVTVLGAHHADRRNTRHPTVAVDRCTPAGRRPDQSRR